MLYNGIPRVLYRVTRDVKGGASSQSILLLMILC